LEETGGPDVTIKCSTPWDAAGKTLDGFTTAGKLSRSWVNDEGVPQVAACETAAADPGGAFTAAAVEATVCRAADATAV
jgi:hypothetical protein